MLARNKGKHFVIKENGWYLVFDIWHGYVNDIMNTADINHAWHFETKEDAERFVKTISYPRRITNYQIVRC